MNDRQLRVLYAFDPRRAALLLIGGDKTGNPKWYEEFVPLADRLFDEHLKRMAKENEDGWRRRMRMARNFSELRRKMSPALQERSRQEADQLIAEMALDELREAQRMTQEHLAKLLGVNQSAISRMERRTDMYISTLKSIIEAMGGKLQILSLIHI